MSVSRHFIGSDDARQKRMAASSGSEAEVDARFQPPYETLAKQTTRRFIKTHLSMQLLPRKIKEAGAKVVYVARNPKDVAVSLYHFQKDDFFGYRGDFETHLDFFMNDLSKLIKPQSDSLPTSLHFSHFHAVLEAHTRWMESP